MRVSAINCPLYRGFTMRVFPWFSRLKENLSAITRCPLYRVSVIERFNCNLFSVNHTFIFVIVLSSFEDFFGLLSLFIRLYLILLSRGAGQPTWLDLPGCLLSWLICAFQALGICKKVTKYLFILWVKKQEICMSDYIKVGTGRCFVEKSFWMSDRQLKWNWPPLSYF